MMICRSALECRELFMRKLLYPTIFCALVCTGAAQAMSYGLVAVGDGRCAGQCPSAIVASGKIEGDESERLLAFLQSLDPNSTLPRNFIVSSPGGDMVGAVDLGLKLRRLGVRTVVGSVAPNPYGGEAVLMPGVCGSACVFVLMAGTNRVVVPGSQVAVHAPQVVLVGQGRSLVLGGPVSQMLIQGTEPVLRSYARQMGVDPAVIRLAHRVPNEARLTLTSTELSRYRLVTGGAVRGHSRRAASRSPGRLGHEAAARAGSRTTAWSRTARRP
jgi:hypothetical protein